MGQKWGEKKNSPVCLHAEAMVTNDTGVWGGDNAPKWRQVKGLAAEAGGAAGQDGTLRQDMRTDGKW